MKYNKLLTFRLGEDGIILQMLLNTKERKSKVVFVTDDEIAMYPILQPHERNYVQLENRFKYWFQQDKGLDVFLDDIQQHGFLYPGQVQLRADVVDLDDKETREETIINIDSSNHPYKLGNSIYNYLVVIRNVYGSVLIELSNEEYNETNRKGVIIARTNQDNIQEIEMLNNVVNNQLTLARVLKELYKNGFVGTFQAKTDRTLIYTCPINE